MTATTAMTVAVVCAAILGALVFLLGANVTRLRGATAKVGGNQMPSDPANPLFIAIRAHGNASEYVPTLIALFVLVAWRAPGIWATVLIIGATVARLFHALGMLSARTLAGESLPRVGGALATYVFGVGLAVATLVTVF